jgi:ABC-type thiamine transport system ATPase subunit
MRVVIELIIYRSRVDRPFDLVIWHSNLHGAFEDARNLCITVIPSLNMNAVPQQRCQHVALGDARVFG